ncbi:MAG: aminotransferase class V-fold PLP-dependent enzyme [Nitrospira sp. SB0672_bin_25]|nr:aminotransferase class V-fold PLP-dependent enzyme [Nitrospira sp. SB0666_bin_27]MYF24481.1 aminotransferase class V-fold PLP-dependent enzyme [Nitrospira sp. SB0678_bin_10]MYJ54628.1 aminotransferase class V-fold PLP-dependent enzyme [Nitrospira sp. SB0672_bin_25]
MIYLNYAALCPTLAEAEEEVERTLTEFKRYLYSEAGIAWYLGKVSDCRQQVGALLHVNDSSSIAFTTNASTAHYLLLSSLKWVPGDTILTTTHENPSITKQLRAHEREGVHVRAVRPTSIPSFLHALEERLDEPGVNAVVISHVSHVDGRIFPIQEVASLARARNCLVVIDGAQAVGHIPVDLNALDFDAYFFAGHKWCEGPLGTGAMVARESFFTHPRYRGIEGEQPGGSPAGSFEIGTHNIGLIAGLARACEQRHQRGIDTEPQRTFRETAKELLGGHRNCRFLEWQGPHAPGILTFKGAADLDHEAFVKRLASEAGVVVKPFVDYPEEDAPAIRLSWSSTMATGDFQKGVMTITQRLDS